MADRRRANKGGICPLEPWVEYLSQIRVNMAFLIFIFMGDAVCSPSL